MEVQRRGPWRHPSVPCVAGPTAKVASVALTQDAPGSGAERGLRSCGGFSISRGCGAGETRLWGGFRANTGMHLKIELSSKDAYTRDFSRHLVSFG